MRQNRNKLGEKSYKWSEEVGADILSPELPPPGMIIGKQLMAGNNNKAPTRRRSQNLVLQSLETPATLGNT